jgi:uncharacterized protein
MVFDAMADTRVVVIQGARQVGKSTLAAAVVSAKKRHNFDSWRWFEQSRSSGGSVGFLNQSPGQLLAIDEVQRVLALTLALKQLVDRDQ